MHIINDNTHPDILFPKHVGRGLDLTHRPKGFAYAGTAQQFPNELLIPRSEWQARIEENTRLKTQLSDLCTLVGIPCKNQQQTNFCHTADTEVLTNDGWISWDRYNGTDLLGTMNLNSGLLEFQHPQLFHALEHDGPIIYSDHRSIDFGVTKNHRMLVRKWDEKARTLSNDYTFQEANKLGWYFGLPACTTGHLGVDLLKIAIPDDREYIGNDFISLLSLIVSDGYAGGTEKTRNWVSFARFTEYDIDYVRAIASRNGFQESPSRPGVWTRYDAGALAQWLRVNIYTSSILGSHNKCVPDIVKDSCDKQIKLFLRLFGDKAHTKTIGGEYFSTSKRLVDDIQELLLRIGRRGTVYSKKEVSPTATLEDGKTITPKHLIHIVHERSNDALSIDRNENLKSDWYKGTVFCATVPNSTLVTRRNGKILISGNCWGNAPTYCTEVIRVIQNQRYVELSPASVCAQITHYQNVGGWGKSALEWIIEHGIVPSANWPDTAINKKYATTANKELALDYRVDEWWELEPRNLDQLISVLLMGFPVAVGYNWWSHEVTLVDPIWVDGTVAVRMRNSWGMEWGDKGYSVIQGQKILPDDAVSPRTAKAS